MDLELGDQGFFSGIEGDVSVSFVGTSFDGTGSLDGGVGISILGGDAISLDVIEGS